MISPIAIVKLIRAELQAETPEILRALLDRCPRTLEDENWRWELRGFASALAALGEITQESEQRIDQTLFPGEDLRRRRLARSKSYSIDIYTLSNVKEVRKFQFDVPGLNPFDAYAKLAMRASYNQLKDIDVAQVFLGPSDERTSEQLPIRTFSREEIVLPRGL
ncbi:MAG TPA: hypothetical protein DCS79_05355 [Gammaproteobacteria bacterium]|nr:hypothetical protein [Gammaproteobacteria bacterium]